MRVGVAWWLFPDESHSRDGSHREYLDRPEKWKKFDSQLFESLLKINKQEKRSVTQLEASDLLSGATFANELIPCDINPYNLRPEERKLWLQRIKDKLKACDLIFLDPDNGIAGDGLKLTRRTAGKSVTIKDIELLGRDDQTFVIYHHHSRYKGGHLAELRFVAERLRANRFRVSGVLRARPWSPRAFFILNGDEELCNRASMISQTWEEKITWHPNSELE